MDFEWYSPNSETLKVSFNDYGITFYSDTIQAMGAPEYVMLGFNEESKIIAVKPCSKEEEKHIPFISKKRNSYVRICHSKFIWFIEGRIGSPGSVKGKVYWAKWEEESQTLYIYLDRVIE